MDFANETGMAGPPRKKTRRGKRKQSGPPGNPNDHHTKLGLAISSGDHAGARKHAFALIRSLPHTVESPVPSLSTDDASDLGEEANATAPAQSKANPARLLAALQAMKKKGAVG